MTITLNTKLNLKKNRWSVCRAVQTQTPDLETPTEHYDAAKYFVDGLNTSQANWESHQGRGRNHIANMKEGEMSVLL